MYLAQLNIARMLAPIGSPVMADFVARLEKVNAQAEVSPGFVWRLKDEYGTGALDQRIFGDDMLLVNVSVWINIEALHAFVFGQFDHRQALQSRRSWFEVVDEPMVVCWWVLPDHRPTIAEAEVKIRELRENGPTREAFPFKVPINPEFLYENRWHEGR